MDGNKSYGCNKTALRLPSRMVLRLIKQISIKTVYLRYYYNVINTIFLDIFLSFYNPLRLVLTVPNNINNTDVEAVKGCYRGLYLQAFKEVKVFKNPLTSQKSHDQV